MTKVRKPRYDSTQRVLNRLEKNKVIRPESARRMRVERNLCPDHNLYLPCPKCEDE